MFIQRFPFFMVPNQKILSKIALGPRMNFSHARMQKPFQLKSFLSFGPLSGLLNNQCHQFSSSKKGSKTYQKQVHKIMKSQMKTDENGQKYILLYDAQKQQKSFQVISGLFLLVFGLTLAKIYYTESQYRKDDYIVLVVIVGSFIVYQKRIFNTLKKITLNSKGDKLSITTFNVLGKGQKMVEAPVELMTGFLKATKLGGNILTGGGNGSGFKEMKFWLTKQYIIDRPTFQYVAHGKCPKIVDEFSTF